MEEPLPAGFDTAARVRTRGVVYPGLIDLHNHVAYNCLPLWAPPERPGALRQPRAVARLPAYTTGVRPPSLALTQVASKAVLKYVETKAVVGGVTAIQGSARLGRPYEGWLVRNVEFETFGSAQRTVFQSGVHARQRRHRDRPDHRITVGGRRRSISPRDPGVPDADMSWRQVLAAQEAVRRDPAGAHERVQVAAAASGEERLRLIPDDPGGEPPVLLAAAELGEVQIPPLDPLARDEGSFAALRSAPILNGLLDDLQRSYRR